MNAQFPCHQAPHSNRFGAVRLAPPAEKEAAGSGAHTSSTEAAAPPPDDGEWSCAELAPRAFAAARDAFALSTTQYRAMLAHPRARRFEEYDGEALWPTLLTFSGAGKSGA